MAHIVQVGAGSGGIVVLDLICRDPRVTRITLIEPDVYKEHNVERHYFPRSAVGRPKADLAQEWVRAFRPDLPVEILRYDLTDPAVQDRIEAAAASATVGVCAVDNEPAKYFWDALMRKHRKPWTLGEVLSGGIGGFVHRFRPEGPCYGCVASFLKREVQEQQPTAVDYSQPGGPVYEVTIPASKASVHAIASLHAVATLQALDGDGPSWDEVTTILLSLQRVENVFEQAFRSHRFPVPRSAECLICQPRPEGIPAQDLDEALDRALAQFGDA
jgi:molybdopterin/thiamine biosynthesis adenylyltransferase